MSLVAKALTAAERVGWPDAVAKSGIDWLITRTSRRLARGEGETDAAFARDMMQFPIALNAREANSQHYEVPAAFFELVLGPQRKYSCCLYEANVRSLADAEECALAATAAHAALADGQTILELGCGWGSFSLWMARNYPGAWITAVSNSQSQRAFIIEEAMRQGLLNLNVITADMNDFMPEQRYDRVVSVEMFEHMANWRALLGRIRYWLNPGGKLFIHVFSHRRAPYRFDVADKSDWIAQNFFTGGIMPSHGLIQQFADCFAVEAEWRWSGVHYQRTARDWLHNFDRQAEPITTILAQAYGRDVTLWHRRWRLFFLATAQLFGHAGGAEWGVSHYLLKPAN